jgi:hypothetical protein
MVLIINKLGRLGERGEEFVTYVCEGTANKLQCP